MTNENVEATLVTIRRIWAISLVRALSLGQHVSAWRRCLTRQVSQSCDSCGPNTMCCTEARAQIWAQVVGCMVSVNMILSAGTRLLRENTRKLQPKWTSIYDILKCIHMRALCGFYGLPFRTDDEVVNKWNAWHPNIWKWLDPVNRPNEQQSASTRCFQSSQSEPRKWKAGERERNKRYRMDW